MSIVIQELKDEDGVSSRDEDSIIGSLAVEYDTGDALTIGSDDGYDTNSTVVVDIGSYSIKTGFARHAEDPPHIIPNVISKEVWKSSRYIGQDAKDAMLDFDELSFPMKKGIVTCWDDMELILDYVIETELAISPRSYGQCFIMTETTLNPKANKEKLTQIMFEKYEVPGLSIIPGHSLSLMSTGTTSGLIVNIGEDLSYIVPIFEDYPLQHKIKRFELGGAHITRYLKSLLEKRGVMLQYDVVNLLKEEVCFINQNFSKSIETDEVLEDVVLPNNLTIQMGHEQFQAPEMLFKPSLDEYNFGGLVEQIVACVIGCDVEVREVMLANIVICGQTSLISGLQERLEKELQLMASLNVKVVSSERYSALLGGFMLESTCGQCLGGVVPEYTMEMYEESGPSIVHRKSQ